MAVLKEIALGGFQVFDQLTRIPIGDLTLLFGPNSAGKSAVADALTLLTQFLAAPSTDREWPFYRWSESRRTIVGRDWRREDRNVLGKGDLRIFATVECTVAELDRALNRDDPWLTKIFRSDALPEGNYVLEARFSFMNLDPRGDSAREGSISIEILINGRPILRLAEYLSAAIDLQHPVLAAATSSLEDWMADCMALAKTGAGVVNMEGGWVMMHICAGLDGAGKLDLYQADEVYTQNWDGPEKPPPIWDALEGLATIYDPLLRGVSEVMAKACSISVVSASRTIPTDKELTYLIGPGGYVSNAPDLNLSHTGIPEFGDLAESCVRLAWKKNSIPDTLGSGENGEHISDLMRAEIAYLVNRMLSDHLFAVRGYRVDVDYQVLVNEREFRDLTAGRVSSGEQTRQPTMLAHLVLADAQGRRFSFTDVGSGLGYVLPVLVGIWSKSRSFIQQPELHLHPALQASLGDVFLEAKNGGHRLIIETHSEHLLLRMLKRIRQGSKDALVESGLKIAADELVVLYFDPSPDGSTKVKQLRVDVNGEFLDRWPSGFFTDRDRELFDDE